MKPSRVSREYLAAGGDRMTREQAERHFADRWRKFKGEILSLPLEERFELVADFIDRGDPVKGLALSLARHCVATLEHGPAIDEDAVRHFGDRYVKQPEIAHRTLQNKFRRVADCIRGAAAGRRSDLPRALALARVATAALEARA